MKLRTEMLKMPFGEIFVFMRLECLGAAVTLPAASLRIPLCSTLSLLARVVAAAVTKQGWGRVMMTLAQGTSVQLPASL